ncbi:MAG: 30S ribosome-binding factor RbfA [Bacteroidia bacterium]|nr:30S ribosome-binding factor RbfA [Bacteroidia bacterium]
MESVRQSKVAKLLQKELAELFRANSKTLFNGGFITVTVVRISTDLSSAKVYLSIMATQDVNALFNHINEQKTHIRKLLGNAIGKQVRIIPELQFYIDDSYDYAEKINALFNKPI